MKTIAAIDQGTTSTRCILLDRTGQPVARAALEAAAYQTREVQEAMNRGGGVPVSSLKGDQRISSLG